MSTYKTSPHKTADGRWWFDWDGDHCGPYDTQREATDDLRGLIRTQRGIARHGAEYVSVDAAHNVSLGEVPRGFQQQESNNAVD